MKSMLLSGMVLMAAAGIYGFVDFNHTKNKTAFAKMYEAAAPEQEATATTADEETIVAAVETNVPAKNTVQPSTDVKTKKAVAKVKTKKKVKTATAVAEPERKLDVRMFSRAPLRDLPVVKEEEVVKEKVTGKTDKEKSPEN